MKVKALTSKLQEMNPESDLHTQIEGEAWLTPFYCMVVEDVKGRTIIVINEVDFQVKAARRKSAKKKGKLNDRASN